MKNVENIKIAPVENNHGKIISSPDVNQYLDTAQLNQLEKAYREWLRKAQRKNVSFSRKRILAVFLLIRYTGAKLNEVLELDLDKDINYENGIVFFCNKETKNGQEPRQVQISERLASEIKELLHKNSTNTDKESHLKLDPGFVRKKFYERAGNCSFPKKLGGPEMIRKARGIELMQSNMPIPAVQMILGHSSLNLTSSYVSFSKDEIQKIAKIFMEKESTRKTSARNSFFGKVKQIESGDIQSIIKITSIDGFEIESIITSSSVSKLGLTTGRLISAEIKAPMVMIQKSNKKPDSSAENIFRGTISRINSGKINTECIVKISESSELCSLLSSIKAKELELTENEDIWVSFNCYSVVLQAE